MRRYVLAFLIGIFLLLGIRCYRALTEPVRSEQKADIARARELTKLVPKLRARFAATLKYADSLRAISTVAESISSRHSRAATRLALLEDSLRRSPVKSGPATGVLDSGLVAAKDTVQYWRDGAYHWFEIATVASSRADEWKKSRDEQIKATVVERLRGNSLNSDLRVANNTIRDLNTSLGDILDIKDCKLVFGLIDCPSRKLTAVLAFAAGATTVYLIMK